MPVRTVGNLPALYEQDETAWLEAMAELAREGHAKGLDLVHLAEFLSDMAKRDRREVESRMGVLLAHLLKWEHQAGRRSRGWRVIVVEQRQELDGLASGGVLRQHAETVLGKAYTRAAERAAAETGLPVETFPRDCPYTIEGLFTVVLAMESESPFLLFQRIGASIPNKNMVGWDRERY